MSKHRRNNVPEVCYLRPGASRLRDMNKKNKLRRRRRREDKDKEYPVIQKFIDDMTALDKEIKKILFSLRIKLNR